MKKFKIIAACALAATMVVPMAACATTNNDKTVLNVVALSAGYGNQWIKTIAQKFEDEHPGYTVNLDNCITNAKALINTHINSKNNIDDLYICVGNDWKTYAAQGKFAVLDDFMNEEVDGIAVKDKVATEYSQSIYFPASNGDIHTYRLPWTAGVGGIYYNKAMFEQNGWNIPETYSELKNLCQQIVDDKIEVASSGGKVEYVTPFVYTSENIDYFDYTVYTWWAQLAGKDNITEFMQYGSDSNYNVSSNPTYAKLKEATELWLSIFGQSEYVLSNTSNHIAQTSFANGKAAMMFNGDWLYNEILGYQINNPDFELALMPTPVVDNAVEEDIIYTIGEDQFIAIPESSIKKDLAQDFIKLMISDWGCQVFMNEAHGLLAYKTESSVAAGVQDEFMKNLLEVKSSYSTAFTNYPTILGDNNVRNSTKMLYLSNLIDIWGTSALRPYSKLLQGGKSVDDAFNDISGEVTRQWSSWKTAVGIK